MLPANRNVVVAIDDSDYAEYAFDCKYIGAATCEQLHDISNNVVCATS